VAERRVRRWRSVTGKRRIVELTLEPGASVALVARANGVNSCPGISQPPLRPTLPKPPRHTQQVSTKNQWTLRKKATGHVKRQLRYVSTLWARPTYLTAPSAA